MMEWARTELILKRKQKILREPKQRKIRGYLNFPQFSYFVKDYDRMLDRSHLRKESFHLGSCFRGCQFVMAEGVLVCGVVAPPWFEQLTTCFVHSSDTKK